MIIKLTLDNTKSSRAFCISYGAQDWLRATVMLKNDKVHSVSIFDKPIFKGMPFFRDLEAMVLLARGLSGQNNEGRRRVS